LNSNIWFLKNNNVEFVETSWLIIIWNKDEIIETSELDLIKWDVLSKNIIQWVWHAMISSHVETRKIMQEFYSKII
jgi:hypothetical protein